MEPPLRHRHKAHTAALWVATAIAALGIGVAGATKFLQPAHWQQLFAGWGYPAWLAPVVGVIELGGGVALVVPRLAAYGAIVLAVVMAGALATLLGHPGGPMGWGATPTIDLLLLAVVGVSRWRERLGH
jgi:putative oxidoreductase